MGLEQYPSIDLRTITTRRI